MKNLDQIRARHALEAAQAKDRNLFRFIRSDVAGFPAIIIQNGLLAAFAYANEEGKTTRAGLKFACDCTAGYLAQRDIHSLSHCRTADAAIRALCSNHVSSFDLQRATSEALAFFGYLKRFAAKKQP